MTGGNIVDGDDSHSSDSDYAVGSVEDNSRNLMLEEEQK